MMSFMEYLLEEKHNVSKQSIANADVTGIIEVLRKAIKQISSKYSKIMALFEVLSNNTGFVLEQVLGYLLNQDRSNGIKAVVNAKSNEDLDTEKQGLSDLDITYKGKTYGISLKTYNAKNNIDLGRSDVAVKASDIEPTRNSIVKQKAYDHTLSEIESQKLLDPKTIAKIKDRINAVIAKLCGSDPSKAETFCWFRKQYDSKGILNRFDFNIFMFSAKALTKFMMKDCVINTSDKAWSLNYVHDSNKIQVIAPQAKNYLTLNRAFLDAILNGTLKDLAVFAKVEPKTIDINTDEVREKINTQEIVKKLQTVKISEMIEKMEKLADEILKS